MKALVYVAPQKVELQEISRPSVKPGEVLLKVSAAGICGSDIHGFLGHSERRKPPLVLGHETVAIIEEAHPSVRQWRPGQRVCVNPLISCGSCPACTAGKQNLCIEWRLIGMDRTQGSYAEFLSVPASQLHSLSEELSESEAVLVEPLANVVHFFRISMAELPDTLAIFGAGPIGILTLLLANLRGIPRVCVIDRIEQRLEVARQLKANLVINSEREDVVEGVRGWSRDTGADFVVDAVGLSVTRRAAVAACARGGRVVFIGMAENESKLPFIEMIRDEKSVFTTFAYTPKDFLSALRLIESGRIGLSPWIETRPLEQGQEAFLKISHNPGATLKMVLKI